MPSLTAPLTTVKRDHVAVPRPNHYDLRTNQYVWLAMVEKLVDERYLSELRAWVGDAVFAGLTRQAADNLEPPLSDLAKAWREADWTAAHEAAHRLKGAAASIGFSALAEAARQLLNPTDVPSGRIDVTLPVLHQLARQSLQALEQWQTSQPQETPVPDRPQ